MKKHKSDDLQKCETIINTVVRSFIKKNRTAQLSKDDLINEGWVAALQTIIKYESFNKALLYIRIRGHILEVVRQNLTLLTGPKRAGTELTQKLIKANRRHDDCYYPYQKSTQIALSVEMQNEKNILCEELKNHIKSILGNERASIFLNYIMYSPTLMELGKRYNYSHSNISYILQRCWKEIKESSLGKSKE